MSVEKQFEEFINTRCKKCQGVLDLQGFCPVHDEGFDITRPIVDIDVDGIDGRDAPDFCDAFISYAVWGDTLEPLTDDELDQLNAHSDFVYEQVIRKVY